MRISDWSSDVCSSDLKRLRHIVEKDVFPAHCPFDTVNGKAGRAGCFITEVLWGTDICLFAVRVVGEERGGILVAIEVLQEGYAWADDLVGAGDRRSEEHTSELQSLMRISYAVFCLKKK